MNENKIVSHGSYVLILPIKSNNGTCKGEIYSEIPSHHFAFEQIVYYLEKDVTEIELFDENLHVVLHYHIFGKEIENIKVNEKDNEVKSNQFKFNGLSI